MSDEGDDNMRDKMDHFLDYLTSGCLSEGFRPSCKWFWKL